MTEPVEKTEKQTSSYDRTLLGNRYQLRGRIESGGMGDVFEARDTLLNREVAIKILKPELSQEPSVVARFKRESEVSAKLTGHPNIVQVLDRGQHEDGRLYIVMELIHGNDLATEINMHSGGDKKMPLDSVLRIFRSIAVAAAHAHAQGVIHRDLKPGNVMIASYRVTKKTEDEIVKVLDFGVAALLHEGTSEISRITRQSNVQLGTVGYMAPEQGKNPAAPSASFDIYSLGAILVEMLYGGLPPQLYKKDIGKLLRQKRPSLPDDFIALVAACLAADPEKRPKSVQDVLEQMEVVGPKALKAEKQLEAREKKRIDRWLWIHKRVQKGKVRTPVQRALWFAVPIVLFLCFAKGVGLVDSLLGTSIPPEGWSMSALAAEASEAKSPKESPQEPVKTVQPPSAVRSGTSTGPDAMSEKVDAVTENRSEQAPVELTDGEEEESTGEEAETSETQAVRTPEHETPRCQKLREEAENAYRKWQRELVVKHTSVRACWGGKYQKKRMQLRIAALGEMKRYEQCAREGKSSRDPEVMRWVGLCQARSKNK